MGYRMCAGSLLANRELYLVYMRLINSFKVEKHDEIDSHPLRGNSDPTSLVAIPRRFRAKFIPRDTDILRDALEASKDIGVTESIVDGKF